MRIKEYKYFKTPQKTARENNLSISDGITYNYKRLFDFSLLDSMPISEIEKQAIKHDALKNICASNKDSYYMESFSEFEACNGIAHYDIQRVFDKSGKRLYCIFRLDEITHNSKTRKSIYDRFYDVKTVESNDGYTRTQTDIEL